MDIQIKNNYPTIIQVSNEMAICFSQSFSAVFLSWRLPPTVFNHSFIPLIDSATGDTAHEINLDNCGDKVGFDSTGDL